MTQISYKSIARMFLLSGGKESEVTVGMGVSRLYRLAILIVGLLIGVLVAPGYADQRQNNDASLPRSFQGAWLGMRTSDLTSTSPDAGRASLGGRNHAHRTIVVPSTDRHLHHVEHRFHRGLLREIAIYYRRDRVPRGYEGLLARLKESYGNPVAENLEEYDPRPEVFSVRKTVWQNQATVFVLAESRKLLDGEEGHDLVLTIADIALQRAYEQDQEQRRRQQELSVPIPLSEQEARNRQRVGPRVDATRRHATG